MLSAKNMCVLKNQYSGKDGDSKFRKQPKGNKNSILGVYNYRIFREVLNPGWIKRTRNERCQKGLHGTRVRDETLLHFLFLSPTLSVFALPSVVWLTSSASVFYFITRSILSIDLIFAHKYTEIGSLKTLDVPFL